jgi:hypothetical protein
MAIAIGGYFHGCFGVILIVYDDDLAVGTKVEIPKHMAAGDRR